MFIEIFNDLLSEKDLNRKQFAEKCGIPYTTVIGWTNLKRLPDFNALIKIAEFFDCSIDYLTGRTDELGHYKNKAPSETDEISMLYKNLSAKDKELALTFLKRLNS